MKPKPTPSAATARLRRRAETSLRAGRAGRQPKSAGPGSAAETQRLYHELQVHQVELELQNAELRKARDDLEEALENFTELYDFAPVGYFTLTESGVIRQLNLTGAHLVGSERFRLVGRQFGHLLPPERRPAFQDFLKQVFADPTGQTGDFELVIPGQPRRFVKLEARRAPHGRECRAAVMDISEQKRAEEVLRGNEALFSALIEQAPVGVYVVDAQFRLRQVNPQARAVFGSVHPLIGRDFAEVHHLLWPKRASDRIVAQFRNTLRTGEAYLEHEHSVTRLDSDVARIYEWQLHRVTLPAGECVVVCYFNDITERKTAERVQRHVALLSASNQKLEQEIVHRQDTEIALTRSDQIKTRMLEESQRLQKQLKRLPQLILSTQEEERKRISRELHDVVAQTLTGINLSLSVLKAGAGYNPRNLDRAQILISEAVDTVHRFARELRPAVLDDIGLIPALRTFMRDFTTQTGIRAELTTAGNLDRLASVQRTVLFRVVQEAFNNAARHAGARHVEVTIHSSVDGVSMTIRNDGKSFDVARALRSTVGKRLGLLGMRERLEMVGGTLSLESGPDHGTTVTARIPHGKLMKRDALPTSKPA